MADAILQESANVFLINIESQSSQLSGLFHTTPANTIKGLLQQNKRLFINKCLLNHIVAFYARSGF